MLDIKLFRDQPDMVKEALNKRSIDSSVVKRVIELDLNRRELLQEVESLKHQKNDQSAKIGEMARKGEDISKIRETMRVVSDSISDGNDKVRSIQEELNDLLLDLPNLPDKSVPYGESEEDNPVKKTWGDVSKMEFPPLSHIELGEKNNMIDFDRGVKIAGNKFVMLRGKGAILARKLQNMMLENAGKRGYTELAVPFIAKRSTLLGSGQLPKFEDDLYKLDGEDSFLIPTGEVPLINTRAGEIIPTSELPIKITAVTSCFRREAGAAGKETRGLIRVHQFEKVELVRLTKPEESWDALEEMLEDAESILKKLKIPYRVITLCTADLTAFTSSKTYDIEVWFPSMNKYVEISSVSNCIDFQARRANIKYRDDNKKLKFVHTLNGSGVAVGRCMASLMENRQRADGSLDLDDIL
ncbi:MAG: serine--tRNA ligase [Caldisericia bacterium]|nr:serine--tRNA ligase [Caldisericia bacterium]